MTTPPERRTAAIAILRAVADLIETHEDVPLPGSTVSFYLHGDDSVTTMAAIASALPCQWHASISRSGEYEWLNLSSDPQGRGAIGGGTRVEISANAADTCVEAGAKTVTVWQPQDAITALLGGRPVEGAQ
jgi:hypothetical protein